MAWTCSKCQTEIEEDSFDKCWNCNTDKHGDPGEEESNHCLRCKGSMVFLGVKEFHEGTRWGALGEIGELFVSKEKMNMYACKSCGKVELFLEKRE